jgi:hypothetical protein
MLIRFDTLYLIDDYEIGTAITIGGVILIGRHLPEDFF